MPSGAGAAVSDTVGETTVQQRVVPTGSGPFRFLQLGEGQADDRNVELLIDDPR